MKTNKIIIILGIVLVIVLGVFAVTRTSGPSTVKNITIGLMLPLTGDYGAAGQNMLKGMNLAIDQYKKEHPAVTLKVITEDDGYEVKKGVSAYKKLVGIDNVDIIFMLSTPVIDAIHEDVVKTGIPVIQLGVQTVGVARDNIFQFSPTADAPIGYLATYLGQQSDFITKKVAVVYDNGAAQIDFFNVFKKNYGHDFTPFVVNNRTDLRGIAIKIAGGNYDAVMVIESPENGAILTKEILTIAKKAPIFAYDAQLQTGFADYQRILGDANKINGAKSMWFKSGKTSEFTKLFKEKYNSEPGFLADFAFDMINVGLQTYSTNTEQWLQNIQATNNPDGVSGAISFDDNGIRIQPMVITHVKNGELVPME